MYSDLNPINIHNRHQQVSKLEMVKKKKKKSCRTLDMKKWTNKKILYKNLKKKKKSSLKRETTPLQGNYLSSIKKKSPDNRLETEFVSKELERKQKIGIPK